MVWFRNIWALNLKHKIFLLLHRRTCIELFLPFTAFYCFLLSHLLFSADNENLMIRQGPFLIHFAESDTLFARQAGDILNKAYAEISYDLGVKTGEEFQVYIMPTRRSFLDALEGKMPKWTGAFAVPSQQLMVIKSPRWDRTENVNHTLVHELVHLLVHNYLGVRDLPRWLDEGIAIFYSGEDRWKTDVAVSKALATGSVIPLAEVDDVLKYHRVKADLAYQESFSAVYYLLTTYDVEALREILYGLKDGVGLDKAFREATGSGFDDFEMEWRSYIRKTHKWLWLYEINDYLWIFILSLTVLAFIIRRIHNKRVERKWQEELAEPAPDERDDL